MSTLVKAELRNRVLEHIGVKAADQSASAEDAILVEEAIDSAHAELRKFGLCPFATSAIPDWAQPGLRDYVAALVKPTFGIPADVSLEKRLAEQQLSRQMAGFKHPIQIRARYF